MIVFPSAKINLGLNVLFKRDDGYHEMESVLYPIPLYDVLELLPAKDFVFRSSGTPIDGPEASNLCVMAYQLMREKYSIDAVYMHLIKNTPMGAGIGGGSADAASVIKGLNDLFELNLCADDMRELAAKLGSDCPFFIDERPALATGRGEQLSPVSISLKGTYLKLIKPDVHISTAEAYGLVPKSNKRLIQDAIHQTPDLWKDVLFNAFETPFFSIHPEILGIKETLYEEGALYASMSGSGSSFYGLFDEKPTDTSAYGKCFVLELN